jgi:TolA-binding protein
MNPKVKLAAYAVLLILAAWFGLSFRSNLNLVTQASDAEAAETPPPVTAPAAATNSETPATASTNATTNLATQPTNSLTDSNNAVADATNAPPASTNAAVAETAKKAARAKHRHSVVPVAADVSSAKRAIIRDLACLIAALIGLGLLIAMDVTQYVGGKAVDYLFTDVGDAMRDPIYERAEAEWANGSFLEAIQSLRDYLKHNPREMHAALRIAEIYEKDLKNYVAAALEYEEVLKHKLQPEKWGWAAIHLCNLYSRLNHHDKTRDLLQRIVDEYPKTGAARKARTRLGLAEPEIEDEAPTEENVETSLQPAAPRRQEIDDEPEEPAPPPEPPKPSLPPGFRPKK